MQRTFKSRVGEYLIPKLPISREAFDILRFEWNAFWVRTGCAVNPFKIHKIRRWTQGDSLSVNVGAGPFGEAGWVNLDLFKAPNLSFTYDCRRKLPFRDNSVQRIRCEHVFEHLDRQEEGPAFLRECYRCLQPGGILRIIVPDAEKFIKAYYENTERAWLSLSISKNSFTTDWKPMDALNKIFHQGGEHKFGYDFQTLTYSLQQAGFTQVLKMDFGQSNDPLLCGDQENHKDVSIYAESQKPF